MAKIVGLIFGFLSGFFFGLATIKLKQKRRWWQDPYRQKDLEE